LASVSSFSPMGKRQGKHCSILGGRPESV
jgi:hypothetical protein